ncbi:hypothetical protein ACH495_08435 [Micromonospora sp. NPDC018662]|uniref:hypothetical protein n=1 Tax=Micromonospora sp. NPDC018662 TaxID=3364238 RepID=UPI0037ABE3BE
MRVLSKAVVVGAVGAAVAATFAGVALAAADDAPTETNGGSIVEDFSYPGAAAILAQQNVELISGDGHIVLADCAASPAGDVGLIQVYTTEQIGQTGDGVICFKALASTGRLDLKVPAVYEVHGDGRTSTTGHNGTATVITDDGERTTKNLDPNGSIQFGIGDGGTEPTTLVQLTVKP